MLNSVRRTLVGDAIDLHLAIDHHARYHASPCRRIVSEIFPEHSIKRLEITRIIEPHTTAHDVLGSVAGFLQNGHQIANRLMRLHSYVALDHFPVHHGHLAGNIEPSIGFDCASEWKMLTTSPLTAFGSVAFYAHCVDSSGICT